MEFIIQNKEWIFSGVGLSIIALVWRLFVARGGGSHKQIQKSGRDSVNIQAGKDVDIRTKDDK